MSELESTRPLSAADHRPIRCTGVSAHERGARPFATPRHRPGWGVSVVRSMVRPDVVLWGVVAVVDEWMRGKR